MNRVCVGLSTENSDCGVKKTVRAAEQDREEVQEQRKEWRIFQEMIDSAKLVFLDETGVNTGMTRLYGRARKDQRVEDAIPDVRFHRTTILSSVRMDGTIVPCVFDDSLNGELFKAYIQEFLLPTLKPGDIVIMDNLSSHKVDGVAKAIASVGAQIRYLPPYSPDLNPIELMWSKVKAFLRKLKVRSPDLLPDAIAQALDSVSVSDILHWFFYDGYYLC